MLMTVRGIGAEKAAEIARIYGTPRALFSAMDEAGAEAPELLAQVGAGGLMRRRVGSSLSHKVADVWFANYT